jgi:Carbonic anhydrase
MSHSHDHSSNSVPGGSISIMNEIHNHHDQASGLSASLRSVSIESNMSSSSGAHALAELQNEKPGENSRLYKILSFNSKYLEWVEACGTPVPTVPAQEVQRRVVIVTCMDARLVDLLPKALNLRANLADAYVIKTAGAILTHPFGGIMRSVLVALYALKCNEVFVIGQ